MNWVLLVHEPVLAVYGPFRTQREAMKWRHENLAESWRIGVVKLHSVVTP